MNQVEIKINSFNVSFLIQKGDGIPLVFLHGFCLDSSMWFDFLPGFPNQYIVCIDLPGFRKSYPQKNCSFSDMASIGNSVLDFLNIKKCILIGHSMGGYVALEFAKLFPKKIAGLCFFHSHPFADSIEKKTNRKKSIDFIRNNGSIYFIKQLMPKLFAPRFGSKSSLTISKLTYLASQYQKEGIINALEAMSDRVDNQEVIKNAVFPILFIVGAEDSIIPKTNSFSQLTLPDISDIHILDGVGHMGMFEAKSKCILIIKNFIGFVVQ